MPSLARLFKINLSDTTDRNAWYLCIEIFWATFLYGAGTFGAAYAVHLGATDFQIGLLSSIPALLAVALSLAAGVFFQHTRRALFWILTTLATHRLGHILLVALPLVGLLSLKINLGMLAVVALILLSVPNTFVSVGFTDLIAGAIPVERRASVFATRNIIYFTTLSASTFIFGYWLGRVKFPFNYQVMFLFCILLSLISLYFIAKVKRPEQTVKADAEKPALSFAGQLQLWRGAFRRENAAFVRLMSNYILYAIGMWMAGPLYILYFVKMLGASDTWLGWNSTISFISMVGGYTLWRRILPRWGEQAVLRRTIIYLGLYPILIAIWPSLTFFLALGGVWGLLGPGTDLSQLNLLMKILPENTRSQYLGLYNAVINLVAFACPMIGVTVAQWIGLRPMLFICGVLAIVGALSQWVWPIKLLEVN
jgi:Major Facilitator Superfamily